VLIDSKSKSEPIKITENLDAVTVGLEPSRLQQITDKFV